MSTAKKEILLHSLFSHCKVPTNTSTDVFDGLVKDLMLFGVTEIKDKAIEIIRVYKVSRKDLEGTVGALYDLFYPPVNRTQTNSIFDFDENS